MLGVRVCGQPAKAAQQQSSQRGTYHLYLIIGDPGPAARQATHKAFGLRVELAQPFAHVTLARSQQLDHTSYRSKLGLNLGWRSLERSFSPDYYTKIMAHHTTHRFLLVYQPQFL